MKPRSRRKRHLLRVSRTERRKFRTEPVYGKDGTIIHYRMVDHPDYVRRIGWWRPGTSWKTKAGQQALKEIRLAARWDAEHATSDCCGWGQGEVYHDPYRYTGTDLVPRRNRLCPAEEAYC